MRATSRRSMSSRGSRACRASRASAAPKCGRLTAGARSSSSATTARWMWSTRSCFTCVSRWCAACSPRNATTPSARCCETRSGGGPSRTGRSSCRSGRTDGRYRRAGRRGARRRARARRQGAVRRRRTARRARRRADHDRRPSFRSRPRQPPAGRIARPARAALPALIERLSVHSRLPQVEVAVGDNAAALVLRHLLPLTGDDHAHLRAFAREHDIHLWLQPGGPGSAQPFEPARSELYYELPDYGVRLHFRPTDFTQVNHAVNRVLVARALELLDPQPGERIADLFCGLGDFSLPLARRGAQAIGFEGSDELVARARTNAAANGLVAQFEQMDLFTPNLAAFGRFDKLLIDPPRQGAIEIVKALAAPLPQRIVYVSCDPATLARDAGVLAHTRGYRLRAAGVVNMFPHTAHVESIALFEAQ